MVLESLNKTFNNREIALISYLLIFIIWALSKKKIRKSFVLVIKAILEWKIVASIFTLTLYVALVVFGLYKIGLWDNSLIKDTVYWTFGVGLIIMMSFHKSIKQKHYFKNLVKENFRVLLVLEFVVGLYVFDILTEFILMPFVIIFSMLLGYTEVYKEHKKVRKLVNRILGILGIVYLGYSGFKIFSDISGFATIGNFKTFLFPIIMSILFLPFAYSYTLLLHYDNLLVRLRIFVKDNKLRRFAIWRILLSVNFSIQRLKRISSGVLFYNCSTKNEIKEQIKTQKLTKNGVKIKLF